MYKEELDYCIRAQISIARLGERELLNWWNTDIAFTYGGADFLKRLLGSTLAPLAAAEAVVLAARRKEEEILSSMPHPERVRSLFVPEPAAAREIQERFRHLKTYPEDVAADYHDILDLERVWSADELRASAGTIPEGLVMEPTGFGFQVRLPDYMKAPSERVLFLARCCAGRAEKDRYPFCYYLDEG